MCPHKQQFVLGRGIVGDADGTPKVACPLHKKTFSLESGACLSGDPYQIETFSVRVIGDDVQLELPRAEQLAGSLATKHFCGQLPCRVEEPVTSAY